MARLLSNTMDHLRVITSTSGFDMTPAKGLLFTSVGGSLSFIQGLITTGQFTDALLLGMAGAIGALTVSVIVALAKKTKSWWSRLWKWLVKIF